jgi:hypothetical protein
MPNKKVFIIGGTTRTSEYGVGNENYEIFNPAAPYAPTEVFPLEPEHYDFAGQVRPGGCAWAVDCILKARAYSAANCMTGVYASSQ